MRGVTPYTLLFFLFVTAFLLVPACSSKSNSMASKTKWTELVGKTGEEAKAAILQDRPGLQVDILPEDAMMTMDFREDRVRIMVDAAGKVVKPPSVG